MNRVYNRRRSEPRNDVYTVKYHHHIKSVNSFAACPAPNCQTLLHKPHVNRDFTYICCVVVSVFLSFSLFVWLIDFFFFCEGVCPNLTNVSVHVRTTPLRTEILYFLSTVTIKKMFDELFGLVQCLFKIHKTAFFPWTSSHTPLYITISRILQISFVASADYTFHDVAGQMESKRVWGMVYTVDHANNDVPLNYNEGETKLACSDRGKHILKSLNVSKSLNYTWT